MSLIEAFQGMNLFGANKLATTNGSSGLSSSGAGDSTQSMDNLLKALTPQKVEDASQADISRLTSGATDTTGTGRSIFAEVQPTSGGNGDSFVNTLTGFIDSVDAKSKVAEQANSDILTGKSDNIHQAMISMQEASISFDLLVQVRNKLVDAYKELSRMSV
jgi:flagellar hook-basal body complex protein FliE